MRDPIARTWPPCPCNGTTYQRKPVDGCSVRLAPTRGSPTTLATTISPFPEVRSGMAAAMAFVRSRFASSRSFAPPAADPPRICVAMGAGSSSVLTSSAGTAESGATSAAGSSTTGSSAAPNAVRAAAVGAIACPQRVCWVGAEVAVRAVQGGFPAAVHALPAAARPFASTTSVPGSPGASKRASNCVPSERRQPL